MYFTTYLQPYIYIYIYIYIHVLIHSYITHFVEKQPVLGLFGQVQLPRCRVGQTRQQGVLPAPPGAAIMIFFEIYEDLYGIHIIYIIIYIYIRIAGLYGTSNIYII